MSIPVSMKSEFRTVYLIMRRIVTFGTEKLIREEQINVSTKSLGCMQSCLSARDLHGTKANAILHRVSGIVEKFLTSSERYVHRVSRIEIVAGLDNEDRSETEYINKKKKKKKKKMIDLPALRSRLLRRKLSFLKRDVDPYAVSRR